MAARSKVSVSSYLLKEFFPRTHSTSPSQPTTNRATLSEPFASSIKEIGANVTSLVRKAKTIASSSSNPSHHAAEVVLQCASVVNRVKLLGMCYDSEESASADTRKHVSVATDTLQETPRTLQSLCQEDSQNVGHVQQNLFELDETLIELTAITEKFKEQFGHGKDIGRNQKNGEWRMELC